jgi:hypothetical protein
VCQSLAIGKLELDKSIVSYLNHPAERFAFRNGRLALAGFAPAVSRRLLELRERIVEQIRAAGVNGVARGNLARSLSIAERDMDLLAKLLTADSSVLMLDGNFILRELVEQCRTRLLDLFHDHPIVDLNLFRDAIGANRKLAVAMLDAFDAQGLTRRVPQGRVLVQHSHRQDVEVPP